MATTSEARATKARRRPSDVPNGSVVAKLVRIGNSRGVRIPKSLIEQAGLTDEIQMTVRRGKVVLQPLRVRRAGWRASIRAALEKHGQRVDEDFLALPNDFDEKEWTWPRSDTTSTSSRSTRRRARK
jgi:antitoxin MazE